MQKLISLRGPIEDPSPVACASRSLLLSDTGLLSYKATSSLINQSKCCFTKWDVDSNVLLLLKVNCLFKIFLFFCMYYCVFCCLLALLSLIAESLLKPYCGASWISKV